MELTGRLEGWDTTILAASRNLFTRSMQPEAQVAGLRTVWTTPYWGNGPARVLNWLCYAFGSFIAGMRGDRPDVVLASIPHPFTAVAGWAIARLRHARFVLEIRDLWPEVLGDTGRLRPSSLPYRLLHRIHRSLCGRADAVVVLAKGVEETLVRDGIPAECLHFIPNGADPDDFTPTRPRDELRRWYGFGGFTLVYAGAHGPANGLDLVLDAAKELAHAPDDIRFVLVGDGLAKDALVERANREQLRNVAFLDPIPKSEVPDLLAAADVGLHVLADVPLFRYGVSPNKLFDYMAAGLPVLTNTGGEVAELVTSNGAGIVTDPMGLAAGARQMASASEEQRRRWGSAGRRFMAEHRSHRLLASRLQELLDSLAGTRRS